MAMTRSVDDSPKSWAEVCAGYDEISVDAERYGLTDRWRSLRDAATHDHDRLEDWLALKADIDARMADDEGHLKNQDDGPLDGAAWLDDEEWDTGREYGCPTSPRCARVEHELLGTSPQCDLSRGFMAPR